MILSSIRWRLQAWHGLILVSILAGFGAIAWRAAHDAQLARVDEDLRQRLMSLFRPSPPGPFEEPPGPRGDAAAPRPVERGGFPDVGPGPRRDAGSREWRDPGGPGKGRGPGPGERREGGRPGMRDPEELRARLREAAGRVEFAADAAAGYYFAAWGENGSLVVRSPKAPADVPRPALDRAARPGPAGPGPGGLPFTHVARTRGDVRELAAALPEGLVVLVGRSLEADRAAGRRLAYGFAAAGAAVLALGLVGGWWLATRAIRPIEDISATALRIAAGDLSQRIDSADTENELGRLADVLNSTFARLEASFAQQARFTSDASHELRTPLAVILSQAQTALARERPADEYREALAACLRAAQRMRRLTESLLDLARLDSGEELMGRAPFDLSRVARESVDLLGPLAAERGVELEAELPPAPCRGDAERIGQVVTNLVKNAIDFNRPGGEVRLAARTTPDEAVLTVSDTGAGIAPADLPHVFDRFYRADRARSGGERVGLGLAIVKAIVDAHSGTVTVESTPGAGSTFTLRLSRE